MTDHDDTSASEPAPCYPSPSRILVAVSAWATDDDGQLTIADHDRRAVGQAAWLAARSRAELRLVHVVDFVDRRVMQDASEVEREVIDQLGPQLEAIAASTGVPTSYEFRFGAPWREIAWECHDSKADLLVIAPKRKLALGERLLFGRTAWRLVRKAPCAILVVHPEARPEQAGPGIDRVLALVDRTEVSGRVIAAADMLADLGGAERHLLTCLDYPNDVAMRRLPRAQQALERYHRDERAKAETYLDRVTATYPERWQHHLGEDWVVRQCPKLVGQVGIDMVVIAATSKPGLAGLLIGSTAEKLIERLPTSCFMVRPDGWSSPLDFTT